MNIDNKKKDSLVLGEDPTQRLYDTAVTAEAKYPINFSRLQRKLCLSLHYNGSNSFLFANATKMFQLKAKDSEIKTYQLYLGNILKKLSVNNMIKTGLNWICLRFFRLL